MLDLPRPIPCRPTRAAVWLLALALGAAGCQTTPSVATLDEAVSDYYAGNYHQSHATAVEVMHASEGPAQEEAAYIAGLSALRLHDLDEAELRLRMAVDADDPDLSAKARASLGLVRLEQGHSADAARLLDDAADELSGADAGEAERLADAARRRGTGRSGSGVYRPMPAPPVTRFTSSARSGRFALQAGAFQQRSRADRVARELERLSPSVRPVNVIPRRDDRGRTLYLVQLGRYSTRQEAASARTALNRPHYIVAVAR